jgi:hypothetical protein
MQRGQWWSIGYGNAQLRTIDAQETELVNQELPLFLGSFPLPIGHSCFGR